MASWSVDLTLGGITIYHIRTPLFYLHVKQTTALYATVRFILIGLDEITFLLEQGKNLNGLLREKVQAAILEKNPYKRG